MSCVYKHTFPNGAVYIGKTNMHPEDRWLNGWGYKSCPLMFNAILQFGWNNVQHEILADNLSEEEALALETEEIRRHSEHRDMSTMVYNTAQVSPQYIAQEIVHFINAPAQSTPRFTVSPSTLPQVGIHKHHKEHIIPLTTKPYGVHQYPIDVYSTDGTYIATYPSAKIASHELHVNNGDIVSCCKGVKADGQPKYQVKGYIFRYHTENPICTTAE